MNKEKRYIIHGLTDFYEIESKSYDQEPKKSVQIWKTKKTKLPSIRLSAIMESKEKVEIINEKLKEIEIETGKYEKKFNQTRTEKDLKYTEKKLYKKKRYWDDPNVKDTQVNNIDKVYKKHYKEENLIKFSENPWDALNEE